MAEEAMEHVRAVCARTRDTVARNAKFNGTVERLFDVERRLGASALAALDASTLADLGEAAERALHALDRWRAASVTNRMKGHDADVESALGELCARGAEVAAEAERAPRGETSHIVIPAVPAVPKRDAIVSTTSSTDPPPFPPTIPTPMRRHPPASAAAAAHPTAEAVPEIPRGGAALSTAAAADANAAYTFALEAEASGHAHVALERLCEAAELGHAAAATRAATALMTAENTGRLRAPDDSRRAARYLRVAVAAGDADAMNALGSMLLRGDEKATGEPRDFQAAARLFAEAGARGCAAADYNLAACLEAGAGVEKDAGKAKSLFRRALSLGVFRAHLPLGYLALHHDEDLGAAARHFSAVSGDVPGDVSAKRLESLGIGEGDVAEATFCLADVSERAADVGLARLERLRASGAVAETLERRLEALRDDGGAFESQKREGENATDDALDLSVHRDAEETAARRDATLRAVAASSAEQDANAAGDLVRHVATARDRARALTRCAAELGDGRAAFRVGVSLWRPTAALGCREETFAAREAAATWVARGAAKGCGAAYAWLGDVAMLGACRLDGVSDDKTARALYARAARLGDAKGARRLAALEEKAWHEAKASGRLRVYPTAPPEAWRRRVPPEWVDETIAGRPIVLAAAAV
jgi:TPR repeat protein